MFICPNCDEKIHWKYSLSIRAQSQIRCVSCGASLTPDKRSYNIAAFLSTIFLFFFLFWVIATDDIIWTLLIIPLSVILVALLFYFIMRFEKKMTRGHFN